MLVELNQNLQCVQRAKKLSMIVSKALFVFLESVQCHTIIINKVRPTRTNSGLSGAAPGKLNNN